MKRTIVSIALIALTVTAFGQRKEPKFPEMTFTTVKENPITPVKNQFKSGTCWAFSGIGFLESEAIRINNIKDTLAYPDFSEFFVVSHSYLDRAEKYVRLDGKLGFGAGSECGDVLDIVRYYGIVPNEAMTGMQYGTELPQQSELDAVLNAYVRAIASKPNKVLSTAWKKGFKGILDAYLGAWPEKFTVNGKEYTPESYRDALKINPDNYISFTSFTHHPFYTRFALELSDNWRWGEDYNIPIDELMTVIDTAINDGYTICWGADVSQWGFTRNGLAFLLEEGELSTAGSDQEHWVGKEEAKPVSEVVINEKEPSQESRQIEFDNKTLTDDHGMQIFGIAKDQNGKKFYMVKNSWGTKSKYNGIWYASEAFVKAQTIDVFVHKDAVSKDLKKKLGVN